MTSDLLAAVAVEHPQGQCFAVPVNDISGGYEYPEVVRFEIEKQDLPSSGSGPPTSAQGAGPKPTATPRHFSPVEPRSGEPQDLPEWLATAHR